MNLARNRVTAWVAMFAILLAALAPTLARALSAQQQAQPWAEICTVAGMQSAYQGAPLQGSGEHDAAAFKHCPFCLTHAGQYALPGAACAAWPASALGIGWVPAFFATPPIRFIRVAAQPRAPPTAS
ncbi:MAG: hypothetical protein A3H93_06030 [Rhodocyclales bacterium RIFCSPLOWO2_02_FULL_63_24]|nr:MAG: hypothetical protein A2040_12690 [Rhodocyclales bacterium GWA2_65_19]OHC68301.1 MAG: hypothetical protein A3H93_06030 [Rhodocyclales bacterium RIFCSPLOWO2_02_FULL_63_24]